MMVLKKNGFGFRSWSHRLTENSSTFWEILLISCLGEGEITTTPMSVRKQGQREGVIWQHPKAHQFIHTVYNMLLVQLVQKSISKKLWLDFFACFFAFLSSP